MDIDLVVELATGGRSSRYILSAPAIEVSLLVIFMGGENNTDLGGGGSPSIKRPSNSWERDSLE